LNSLQRGRSPRLPEEASDLVPTGECYPSHIPRDRLAVFRALLAGGQRGFRALADFDIAVPLSFTASAKDRRGTMANNERIAA
jgi:hypothetical protein